MNKESQPPPTPLNTLEEMHALCMRLEECLDDLKTMGHTLEIDDIETTIYNLTSDIQTIIDSTN